MFLRSSKLALYLIENYRSKWDKGNPLISQTDDDYAFKYALEQFKQKTKNGIGIEVWGKDVLEIGCGHGGICLFLAAVGAKKVIGIDISKEALSCAKDLKNRFIDLGYNYCTKVDFEYSFVEEYIPNQKFDVIIADNIFEHVENIEKTLLSCFQILKPEGIVYVYNFPSIYSKFGPHLKYGTKIPWLHIFFTEEAICKALYLRAIKNPELKLFEWYKGLKNNPKTFKEIRAYKDLNYITQRKFLKAVNSVGFIISSMHTRRSNFQKLIMKFLPFMRFTILDDILSSGTNAILKMPK